MYISNSMSSKVQPSVSVVVPLYNASDYICNCLNSILGQETDYTYEVLVVDDGSTDESANIVRSNFPQITLLEKKNGGAASARNLGVFHAKSNIIILMDADDIMLPGRIQHQTDFMMSEPQCAICYGDGVYSNNEDASKCKLFLGRDSMVYVEVERPFLTLLENGPCFTNGCSAIRRNIYLELGGQNQTLRVNEDYYLALKIALNYRVFITTRPYTWVRRESHGNLTTSKASYTDPLILLREVLLGSFHLLPKDSLEKVRVRYDKMLISCLGHLWIENNKIALRLFYRNFNLFNSFKVKFLSFSFQVITPKVGKQMRLWKKKFFNKI